MLYDTLNHIDQYEGIHTGVMKGLRYLAETDFSAMPDGRLELDGKNLFILLQSYDTKEVPKPAEAHKKYIDIQCILEGEELVGVAPLEEMTGEADANPDGDIWHYYGDTQMLSLRPGRFIVLWPGDAHAPAIAPGGKAAAARKCVVKILL